MVYWQQMLDIQNDHEAFHPNCEHSDNVVHDSCHYRQLTYDHFSENLGFAFKVASIGTVVIIVAIALIIN